MHAVSVKIGLGAIRSEHVFFRGRVNSDYYRPDLDDTDTEAAFTLGRNTEVGHFFPTPFQYTNFSYVFIVSENSVIFWTK